MGVSSPVPCALPLYLPSDAAADAGAARQARTTRKPYIITHRNVMAVGVRLLLMKVVVVLLLTGAMADERHQERRR